MLLMKWFTFLLSFSSAIAAERYVSPTGNNNADGAEATPWKTIQKAANTAAPGDIVYVKAGTYVEYVKINRSGTATQPILFRNYPGDTVIIDPNDAQINANNEAVITIRNQSHIIVQGFTVEDLRYRGTERTPVGILVESEGSSTVTNVQLRGNTVRKIYNNYAVLGSFDANAHGIAVFGGSSVAISELIIDGNEVYDLRLGASEAVVVNGNINGFRITNNRVHHCNNIAIDVIGFEGVGPTLAKDRARNGIVAGNLVYAVDSSFNPAYNGSLTTGGGDTAAAGIYVDGGRNCVVERNEVHSCNFGIEVASEAINGEVNDIIVRNNLLHHNQSAGIILGGFEQELGTTTDCQFNNNTLYQNGTRFPDDGQIILQYNVDNCVFRNNIIVSHSDSEVILRQDDRDTIANSNVFSHNLYWASNGLPPKFLMGELGTFTGLSAWQAAQAAWPDTTGRETGSSVADPRFTELEPTQVSPATAYHLRADSPAIDTARPNYNVANNERDFFNDLRKKATQVDRGAAEQ
jgi:parallel beta-helix repeat protein